MCSYTDFFNLILFDDNYVIFSFYRYFKFKQNILLLYVCIDENYA